jgi:hypothetical protein
VTVVHFFDRCPAPDASVFLDNFPHRTADHPLDPLLLNDGTIRAPSNEVEVFCEFHRALAPYSPALHMQGSVLKTPSFIYYPASMPPGCTRRFHNRPDRMKIKTYLFTDHTSANV